MGNVFYDMSQLSEMEKVEEATEKKISKKEFEEAMHQVIDEQINDPDLKDKGMASFIIPMLTVTTIGKMRRILFGEEDK